MPLFVRQQEIEHEIGPSGRFALRVTSPDVEIRATDAPKASVGVEFELKAGSDAEADQLFERVKYQVSERDGVLEVNEPRHGNGGVGAIARVLGLGSAHFESRVVAQVPADADVTFEGVSGDLDVVGMRGRQEYRTVSGDIQLRDTAGDLRVRGVSSDISLRADGTVRLELNSVSGDVSAIAPRYDALRVATVSGDVEIEGELSHDAESRVETVSGDLLLGLSGGATIEVRALSSNVSIGTPHRAEGSRDRRRFIVGDGAARFVFSSMSGDFFARPPRRGSPTPPTPPTPPTAPTAPTPPKPPVLALGPDEQLAVLRALERGEISVDEAASRLGGVGAGPDA
jgi:hypothetical protein